MREVIKGSDAISGGQLTEWALRRWYRPIFRDADVHIIDRAYQAMTSRGWKP